MPTNYETALPETFNPEVEEGTHFDVVPVGEYVAQITEACVAQPKSGDGHFVGLTWQITEGEHEGRFVWQRVTFLHSSEQATRIGRAQIKDLCVATGQDNGLVDDVSVFRFIPCRIKVGVEKDKQGIYADKNRVSRVLPLEEPKAGPKEVAAKSQPKPQAKPQPKPAVAATTTNSGGAKPWPKTPAKRSTGEEINDEVPR